MSHIREYPSPTPAAEVVAMRNRVEAETDRHWYLQAQVDACQRRGSSSEELTEINELQARGRRLEDDHDTLHRASIFFAGELDPNRDNLTDLVLLGQMDIQRLGALPAPRAR